MGATSVCCGFKFLIFHACGDAGLIYNGRQKWGGSSVGRALRSQCRGRGFNSPPLHFVLNKPFDEHVEGLFYFRDERCVVEAAIQKQKYHDLALCGVTRLEYEECEHFRGLAFYSPF